ncbi:hypothetical protein DLH72_00195 [Candidatus Gracilibacteria bacterium]|nr:MAG: hypothetical protein DLH72_00195 [Candidatus Gracilibacteria bacterium]
MLKKILISFLLFVFSFSSSFADDVILNQIQNSDLSIFSSENSLQNDSQISGTGTEENGPGETNTGAEESGTGTSTETYENFLQNFEIKNKFQRPTYLKEKDIEKDEYVCDDEECKVNFDFRISFEGDFKEKDYICEISYLREKEENCNPNTIIFQEKETEFLIKIFPKDDRNIFKERKIIIKKENLGDSGNGNQSGTGETNTGTEEAGTGTSTETYENFLQNFEIKNKFQRPTYLKEKDIEKDEYICDDEECKVNFDFRVSFEGDFKEKDYICEMSYLGEKEENCNPNTIIFQEKETEFLIKIFPKDDRNVFKERKIIIKKENLGDSGNGNQSGTGETNTGTEESGTGTSMETYENFLQNFEIKNKFQNPTYLQEKDIEKDEYICSSKDCKVNFDLRNSFSSDFKIKDYVCELSFLNEKINNCNPQTINFPSGITEISLKIFPKDEENIFKERKIIIKNVFSSGSGNENIFESVKIKVQSGLIDKKCEIKNCKVNFIFETKNKNLSCFWKFSNGNFKEGNQYKCNPSSVSFPSGKHLIILRVFDKNNENIFQEDYFEFENTYDSGDMEAEIILKGKSKKYQKNKNLAVCYGVETCSLNFGVKIFSKNIKKFFWDFGNGKIFEGKNPDSIEFSEGKYNVSLELFDENDKSKKYIFYVEVKKEKYLNLFEKIFLNNEKHEKLFDVNFRKNQDYLSLSGENNKNIFVNQSFDFPIIGKFIYNKDFEIKVDEIGNFKENFLYDRAGNFNFSFYEVGENGEKIFSENKKIEITQKNFFTARFRELEKEKIKQNKEFKIKKEEEKFLKITLQGKTTKNKFLDGKSIICIGKCNLNFGLETNIRDSKKIIWDLGNSEIFSGKNPKSKKYSFGSHKVEVKYEDENGVILTDFFEIKVNKKTKKSKKKKKAKKKKIKTGPVNIDIKVQGKIGKNKILTENKLVCIKTCSVNFDGSSSSGSYKELVWDFGNGEKFIGENPKSVKYKDFGNYQVIISAEDFSGNIHTKKFEIEFIKTLNKPEKQEKIEEKNFKKDEISKKEIKKDDIFFILFIMFMMGAFSLILLRKYKIF